MLTDDAVIDHSQLTMALPLQTACHVGKLVALKWWHSNCGSTDAEQYLCMDSCFRDIWDEKCLIYSFAIADNYDFETQRGKLGVLFMLMARRLHCFRPLLGMYIMKKRGYLTIVET